MKNYGLKNFLRLNRHFKLLETHSSLKHNVKVTLLNRLILQVARKKFIQFILCQCMSCSRFEDGHAVVMNCRAESNNQNVKEDKIY
jgi:hypothetical protein